MQTKSVPLLYGHTLDNLGLTKCCLTHKSKKSDTQNRKEHRKKNLLFFYALSVSMLFNNPMLASPFLLVWNIFKNIAYSTI